ncbi:heterokaryon incompatibility protein-domain-containing protein [Podospora aff. communis PSN243]|uniref:Heterokaryon incompatibility protein-domain-containing protein n=1 Tax=Podospora aff. communis PSN243 TaxID=3040156 RepID=A0AAV9H3N2_9PEZI|nr:heterokaryon incompatibility protein-domain-containing protein [Podospora aff. communis PSN243]
MVSIYQPLNPSQIRLLHIAPGPWSSPLNCTLVTYSLPSLTKTGPSEKDPPFTALSYTWGPHSPSLQVPIQINNTPFLIGRNLHTALRYYRRCGWEFPIWADAICINQEDLVERAKQVKVMDGIYSAAREVVVFLGAGMESAGDSGEDVGGLCWYGKRDVNASREEADGNEKKLDEETSVLFEFLQGALGLKINDHLSEVSRWGRRRKNVKDADYPWDVLVSSLKNFLDAPWWSRVWTIQESVVGMEPTIFYRGGAASWEFVVEAVGGLEAHVNDCCTPYLRNDAPDGYAAFVFELIKRVQDIQRARKVYHELRGPATLEAGLMGDLLGPTITLSLNPQNAQTAVCSRLLLEYLQAYQQREATDPRDKIYSLLPLVKIGDFGLPIEPDYEVSTPELFVHTARTIIETSGSLDILATAGTLQSDSGDLPSWCPDWSGTSKFYPERISQIRSLQWYNATHSMSPQILFSAEDPRHLRVEGVEIDRIASLGNPGTPEGDIWRLLFEWTKMVPNTTKWLDFCRTVRGDVFADSEHSFYRMGGELRRETSHERCWVDPATGELREELPSEEIVRTTTVSELIKIFREWDRIACTQAARLGSHGGGAPPLVEEQVRRSITRRRFMVSTRGDIGLVPATTAVGDALVLLRGCKFPCVLRSLSITGGDARGYRVVGSAYIHGMMDGEFESQDSGLTGDAGWESLRLE